MSLPPPDKVEESPLPISTTVLLHSLGLLWSSSDVEVLARDAGDSLAFYRFVLPRHARVVRKFWQSLGVKNPARLDEGTYELQKGLGPFGLEGSVIGYDLPNGDGVGTRVVDTVRLTLTGG